MRRRVRWTGNVTWGIGMHDTLKFIGHSAWTTPGVAGTLSMTDYPGPGDAGCFTLDLKAHERYALFYMTARKTTHVDVMTWAVRAVHAYAGPTADTTFSRIPNPGAGSFYPFLGQPTGSAACFLAWQPAQGGIIDSQTAAVSTLNPNTGIMPLMMNVNMDAPLNSVGCVRVLVEIKSAVAALTGNNIWALECGFIVC